MSMKKVSFCIFFEVIPIRPVSGVEFGLYLLTALIQVYSDRLIVHFGFCLCSFLKPNPHYTKIKVHLHTFRSNLLLEQVKMDHFY